MDESLMEIVRVDPHDDAALRAWHGTYLAAETSGRPFAAPWNLEEVRAAARAEPVAHQRLYLSGLVDGDVVCVGQAILSLKDNRDNADLTVHTHPDHHRRGHGSRMLQRLEQISSERGRSRLVAMVDHAYALGPGGEGDPGVEFLRAHGFQHSLGEVQSVCPVPMPAERLAELADEAAGHHQGYTLRGFVDRCPGDLIGSFGRLLGMLVAEAPTGTLGLEPEVFDEERIRAQEAMTLEAGRACYSTVALDRDGAVVAYTQLAVSRLDPAQAYQWGTLVDPAHRGHRLGLAVKSANLALLQEHEPLTTKLLTYNAEVNDHMLAVNRRFGFVPVARSAEFLKVLA